MCAWKRLLTMKRCCKICVLLLLVDLSLGEATTSSNITVLASINAYDKTFYCVTSNDVSALTWVTPRLNENPYTRYTSGSLDILCDMDPQQKCSRNWARGQWQIVNSSDFVYGPIFDYRWERFKVIETGDDYEVITNSLNHDDFKIAFSIRIEKDAYIYLCDGKDPPKANCYWFILSGWKGLLSVIRKCEKSQIPQSLEDYPKAPCKTALDQKEDTVSRVNKGEWTHFVLKGKQGTYTLRKLGEPEPFLTYTDRTRSAFQPNHLIIRSRHESQGIWKFHLYPFLLTTHQEQVQLGPLIVPENGMICVAFFTKMCQDCLLHLTLADSSNQVVHTQQYQSAKWAEIKFLAKNLQYDYYKLSVTTISNDSNGFWALDDVRRCTENDIRVVEIKHAGYNLPDYACHSLGLHTLKIDLKDLKDIETSGAILRTIITCVQKVFPSSVLL